MHEYFIMINYGFGKTRTCNHATMKWKISSIQSFVSLWRHHSLHNVLDFIMKWWVVFLPKSVKCGCMKWMNFSHQFIPENLSVFGKALANSITVNVAIFLGCELAIFNMHKKTLGRNRLSSIPKAANCVCFVGTECSIHARQTPIQQLEAQQV